MVLGRDISLNRRKKGVLGPFWGRLSSWDFYSSLERHRWGLSDDEEKFGGHPSSFFINDLIMTRKWAKNQFFAICGRTVGGFPNIQGKKVQKKKKLRLVDIYLSPNFFWKIRIISRLIGNKVKKVDILKSRYLENGCYLSKYF